MALHHVALIDMWQRMIECHQMEDLRDEGMVPIVSKSHRKNTL